MPFRWVLPLACSLIALPCFGQVEPSSPGLIEIKVDGKGSGQLWLTNKAKRAQRATFYATAFTSDLTARTVPGSIQFNEAGRKPAAIYTLGTPLKANETRRIFIQITDFADAPEATASLRLNEIPSTDIHAGRLDVPFTVSLLGSPSERPVLQVPVDQHLTLDLKNADALTYGAKCTLRINGQEYSISTVICANGITRIPIPDNMVREGSYDPMSWLTRLLRPESSNAFLRIEYAAGKQAAGPVCAVRTFPLVVQASYFSPDYQVLFSTAIIFVVLLIGGVTSLLLNASLPRSAAKARLGVRLAAVARMIGDLSMVLGSRARVGASVQRKRLRELLQAQFVISPDFDTLVKPIEDSLTLLEKRVDLLRQLEGAMIDVDRMIGLRLPPSLVDRAEQKLDECVRKLSTPLAATDELQLLTTAVSAAIAFVDRLNKQGPGATDTEFARNLCDRLNQMKTNFPRPFSQAAAAFEQSLPGYFRYLSEPTPDPATLGPDDYFPIDNALERLGLIRRLLDLQANLTVLALQQQYTATLPEFTMYLSEPSWDALKAARLLTAQLEQGIGRDAIDQAIRDGNFSIETSRDVIRRNDQVEICICFCNESLNHAAARDEFRCNWTFQPVQLKPRRRPFWYRPFSWVGLVSPSILPEPESLLEPGWTVDHYFLNPGDYSAEVSFIDWFGRNVPTAKPAKQIHVSDSLSRTFGARTVIETVRLGVALLVALLALVAGARDQLDKVEVLPGLLAVFLLGFGADSVKNLLTQKN